MEHGNPASVIKIPEKQAGRITGNYHIFYLNIIEFSIYSVLITYKSVLNLYYFNRQIKRIIERSYNMKFKVKHQNSSVTIKWPSCISCAISSSDRLSGILLVSSISEHTRLPFLL